MADIIALILKIRSGDDNAFSELVTLYTPMMQSVASKYRLDYDECFSDLCMALYRAVESYDIEQSEVTFGLFAKICIVRSVSDMLRRDRTEPVVESDADVDAIAVDGSVESDLIKKEEREAVRRDARLLLSEYEYGVLLRWLAGDKTADIAESLGVSAKSVDNAKARIQKKLREGLRPFGL